MSELEQEQPAAPERIELDASDLIAVCSLMARQQELNAANQQLQRDIYAVARAIEKHQGLAENSITMSHIQAPNILVLQPKSE
jgi:hypothetical protein